jgi:hypothetical protein
MKRVKAKVGIQGNGWAIDAGEIQDWGDDRAALFLKSGDVELIEDLNQKVEEPPKKKAGRPKR